MKLEKIIRPFTNPLFVYDLNLDLDENNRMGFLNTIVSNKSLPEKISMDLYKTFIEPNINLSAKSIKDAVGSRTAYFISNFVKSPTLSKEAKLDIINKAKITTIFKPYVLQQLITSRYLEREVAESIIKKFGFDESGIIKNSTAPITDYALKEIIEQYDLMTKITVKNFNESEKNDVVKKLCKILSNPHAKDGEIKYIMSVLSPVLKEIASLSIDPNYMPDYFYEICYNMTDEGNVTADHLSAANLTLEEEIKLLKDLTYSLWYNDEDSMLDNINEEVPMLSYDEFKMTTHGLDYLDTTGPDKPGKNIKKAFSRAYNYFVNYKKHGVG